MFNILPKKADRTKDKCGRCGYDKTHRKFPAMGQQCSFCKKMNHYSKLCRSRQVHHLQEEDDSKNSSDDSGDCGDESPLFVYAVESNSLTEDEQFHETVELEGTQVKVQLDSGAKAYVISLQTYSSLKCRPLPPLRKTRTVLVSLSNHKLKPRGEVALTTRYKDQVENVKFFVVDTEVESVLSGNSCLKLGLLKRVYQLTGQELPYKRVELEDYPELCTGLGCLPDTHHIELAEGAVPVVHAPRKVPVPQRAKVVEELKRMEKLGVIVRQEEPTEWVNSLVVVQKPTGAVRLRIDARDLNLAIERPHYPMKTIDEVASLLQDAKIFRIRSWMPLVVSGS